MSIGPTLLRAFVLGVASVVPENSPLDSVVFRSSLQILIGVVYVIVFYFVSALVRVLMGRHALMDPTESVDARRYNVRYDVDDIYEYEDPGGPTVKSPLSSEEGRTAPVGGDHSSGSVASGTATILVRVGRNMERRVSRIGPKLKRAVKSITSVVLPVNSGGGTAYSLNSHAILCDDHSPARPRAGSIDGGISDSSSLSDYCNSDAVDVAAGVEPLRGGAKRVVVKADGLPTDQSDGSSTDHVNGRAQVPDSIHKNRKHPTDEILGSAHISVPVNYRGYHGGVYETVTPPTGSGSDRIYTDVYGLGFAAFVLHYTMDCSSMQPTMFLLIGLTILGARDVSTIATSVVDNVLPQATLFTRALTVISFILLVIAQICMILGIVRVPTYHTDARDGSVTLVPAPQTILEHCLARVLPMLAPFALYMVSKKTGVVSDVAKTLRRAMPTTVLMAMWFITCFGAMSDQIRNAVGAISVNATVAELSVTDVAINMQLPLLILSPFVKIPALLAIVSCCLTRKTMDIVAALCIVFYAKQLYVVRDREMLQMLNVAFMCACMAWFCLTLRYCTAVVNAMANLFEPKKSSS
jgi:hypothetical protein